MIRYTIYKSIFILFFNILFSITFFVNVQAKEIKYKVSDIPKELRENARSVIRNEHIVFEIKSINSAIYKVTRAITILNKNGIEDGVLEEYYDKFMKISSISGKIYDENGEQIKRIPADEILDHSAISGYSIYEESRVKYIDPKYRTVPYTVEYTYEIAYNGLMSYPEWSPTNYNISVEKSSFNIITPKNFELRYLEKNLIQKVKIQQDDKNTKYSWELVNFKAILHEPFSANYRDYYPTVILAPSEFEIDGYNGNLTTWEKFGNWRYSLIENRNILSEETKNKILSLTANENSDFSKVQKIYEFVQGKTRYVSIQEGIGGWQPIDASTVDRLSYGDCKALTNYTKSLLEIVGFKPVYTVVKAGEYASDWIVDFPSNQSNHAFLCVPLQKDTIWLECTNQRMPCGYISDFTDDRDVLLIEKDKSRIVHTKSYSATDNTESRTSTIKFTKTNGGEAVVNANYKGQNYDQILPIYLSDDVDKKKRVQNRINLPTFQLNTFTYKENREIIPSFDETLKINFDNYGTVSGQRIFLPVNFINRLTNLPERVRNRKTDVLIRRPFTEIDTCIYELPANYKIEGIPQPSEITSPYGIYKAKTEVIDKKIVYSRFFQINKGKYPPSAYADFLEFLEKVSTADRIQCSLVQ